MNQKLSMTAKVLAIIGGINWGLVGIGGFASTNLNLVKLLFGSIAWLESIVYILVGIAATIMLIEMIKK